MGSVGVEAIGEQTKGEVIYSLTAAGKRQLAAEKNRWEQMSAAIAALMQEA